MVGTAGLTLGGILGDWDGVELRPKEVVWTLVPVRRKYTIQCKHLTTLHSIQPYKVSPASGCAKGLWNLLIERSDMAASYLCNSSDRSYHICP